VSPLPFQPETPLEARICSDPEWQAGAAWGEPRPGHQEGAVMHHIADVLANVERQATSPEERRALRLIALIHDTFKYRVDQSQPKTGPNHHAAIARAFAERYLDDPALLDIIELHDEAYNSWLAGARNGRWPRAEERARRLVDRLGPNLALYARFYRCDNRTASKEQDSVVWFEDWLARNGLPVPPDPEAPAAT
jgi:hypothetical protein